MEVMAMVMSRRAALGVAIAAFAAAATPAFAQKKYDDGATDTEIKVGHTNPYQGNLSSYGQIGKTIEAVFKMVNDNGGINGRKVNFVTYDDGYVPAKTLEMVRKLVEQDKVLLLFNTLGTPTNSAIHKYVNQKKIPHTFVASGASKWGNPKEYQWSMGWQPDYATEAGIYAKHILANVKDPKIAMIYQNDDSGRDYLDGFKAGLGPEHQAKLVKAVPYEATDPTVDSQIIQLKETGANVFFIMAGPKHAAQAIKKSAELGWKAERYITNVSVSIGSVLKPAGLDNSVGLLTAQYLKEVTDPQYAESADVKAFKAFMAKYMPNADIADQNHTYGYAVTMNLVAVLKQCKDDLTRENVMRQMANMKGIEVPLTLDGIKANTSPTDFFPLQSVKLAKFNGTKWETFGATLANESK
jgi:branched-chain amino acid transport system substrate-binding protein